MRHTVLTERLDRLGREGISAFSTRMLKSYFPEEPEISLKKTLARSIKNGVLERVCRGAYVYSREFKYSPYKLEAIAVTLRAGEYSYISLESALSEYSVISQMLLSHLTVMTTGRSQTYHTPYGTIEFTHTERGETEILSGTVKQPERPLRLATPGLALADLKRVKRNLDLVNMDVYEDIIREKNNPV